MQNFIKQNLKQIKINQKIYHLPKYFINMEQEKKVAIKSIEELEQYWNNFSQGYAKMISPNVSPISVSMLNMLKIENKSNILEIAVGPGYYLPHLIQRKNPSAKLYLTDLSPDFLAICKKRIDNFLENPITGPYQEFNIDNLPKFESETKVNYEKINTVLHKANSENLVDFQDNQIDAYICSLCLQLTSDPIKQVKECYRVLQPGGQAIFSVWGEKNISLMVDHMQLAFEKFDIPIPQERTNFHLNDKQKLIDMFKENGFEDILAWNQFMPANIIMTEEQAKNATKVPRVAQMLEKFIPDEAKRQELCQYVENILLDSLKNKNFPIGIDTLNIIVKKPLKSSL